MKRPRVGVDTGGTFTDFVRLDGHALAVHKVRTTTPHHSDAIIDGLRELDCALGGEVVHGSTVATNAVLERKGARVALVATEGLEDVLSIGRQTRPALYDLDVDARRSIVEPGLTFGVPERLSADGLVVQPVDMAALGRIAERIVASDATVTAVCLLHAYANPAHEDQVADTLRRAGLTVRTSHETLPEYREYERWSTTVLNAYVTPIADRYLERLERLLGATRLSIMQSNGGSISSRRARSQPVRIVLSGPAGGVVGAQYVAAQAGHDRIISFDMGGTSTDVSLVDGRVTTTTESVVGDFPVRLPMVDVHTVGAGGGSIVRVDHGGALVVGPESAGANPGPACYGTGSVLTVTDANLLVGRLDPEMFLGGRMRLDVERARAAAEPLARALKVSMVQLCEAVIRVANAGMERAIRRVSLERGYDPREFTLVAFGGAGGMHACEIAADLGIETILVPKHAGVLSALGMLAAPVAHDFSASLLEASRSLTNSTLNRRFAPLVAKARRALQADGIPPGRQRLEREMDVRYVGQSYEITVPFSTDYVEDFHRRHERRYGYANAANPTEVVSLRVRALGLTDPPPLGRTRARTRRVPPPRSSREGVFNGRRQKVAMYRWTDLPTGSRGRGPAVISGGEATIVVPPAFSFAVDAAGNVVLRTGMR